MVLHMVKDKKLSYIKKQLWLVQIRGLGRKLREWTTALCILLWDPILMLDPLQVFSSNH